MTRALRYARTFVALFAAAAAVSATFPARAATEGRISLMNDVEMLTNPNAMIDAMLLRVFLTTDHIGGSNTKFVVDLRSDLPVLATAQKKYGTGYKGPFNGYCHGDDFQDRQKCRNIAIREQRLGQLAELAGIYDLYVQFGQSGPGHTTLSIGRKTVYEAGLVTVDGLTLEKGLSQEARLGVFGGLAPDPLTRMVSPLYQTAGGYFAYTKIRSMIRFGASALNYAGQDANKFGAQKGPLAQATVFNQNFFLLSKGVSIATYLNFDVIPGQDRLEYIDFTFKPTSRYRIRLNATRFRPVQFDRTPELLNGGVIDPAIIAAYLQNGAGAGPFTSRRSPEVSTFADRSKPIDLAKLAIHYVTANSITPYISAEYRMRELDSKTEILADIGAYTYDPYDSGITARLRFELQSGYDTSGFRFGGNLERAVTENVIFGGGFDLASYAYALRNKPVESHYTTADQTISANLFGRYDRPRGLSFFLEAFYLIDTRKPGSGEPGFGPGDSFAGAPKSTTQLSVLAGITVRFGASKD